ncbi:MAG TPA: ABC transporter permease [Vicinamibacterales bacterium]|nr:ABC transporter permease [Vicinamibacterales bacterium]
MDQLRQDFRYALRTLGRTPGFAAAVALTLALGVGAATAIFTVVDATLVRGLPYPDAGRLVQITMTKQGTFDEMEATYPAFLDWKAQSASFASLAGYQGSGGTARFASDPPRPAASAVVTADFFRTLGVEPALGRDFAPGNEDPAGKQEAILSYGVWQREFGGDPAVVGRAFAFNGASHTIIGVLPASFSLPPIAPTEIYRPVERMPFQMRRNLHWLNVIGRLAPGVTMEEARAEMAVIAGRLAQQYPDSEREIGTRIVTLHEAVLGDIQSILVLLFAAAGLLLLVAWVNVVNLLLARLASRRQEIAVRVALGASRGRLVRQSLTESLVLSAAGAVAGLVMAYWALGALLAAVPESLVRFMPYLAAAGLDGRALAFTTALTLLIGVVLGLAPLVPRETDRPQDALSEHTRTTAGGATQRLHAVLVGGEVALAVVLLSGAFLTTRSLLAMLEQDPGFDTRNLATLRVLLPTDRYPDADRMVPALREIQARLSTLPGVEGVGLTNRAPFQEGNTVRFRLEHEAAATAGEQAEAMTRSVDPSYFDVLKARLIRGRTFDTRDEGDGPPVVIVNRTLAERSFPGRDAVGQRIVFTFAPDQPAREIIGVIDDVREGALDSARQPVLYNPLMRSGARVVDVMLRTAGDPAAQVTPAERALKEVDAELLLLRGTTMETVVASAPWVFFREYPATLTSVFAVSALLLAAVGLFGMISYVVVQRTREIGIRMALGARPGDVMRLIMGRGLGPALAGIVAGLAGALALARVAESLLFGVSAGDPLTFLLVPLVVIAVATAATYMPARRAMRLDPMAAVRERT